MVAFINLTGQRFGRLVVLESFKSENKRTLWECRCDCGVTGFYIATNLRRGNTRSCGCYLSDRIKETFVRHGMTGTKPYRTWLRLRRRCNDENNKDYHNYGGRGISVCERWKVFENFYDDMGDAPSPKHSIDRIDVNGNYEPLNCKWSTQQEQADNCRHTIYLDTKWGKITVREASAICGIKPMTIKCRRARGVEGDALFAPINGGELDGS